MRRGRIEGTTFLAVAILLGSMAVVAGRATAEYSLRPPLTWRADDRTVSFGNTAAAPDWACEHSTTDASDHHLECVGAGTEDAVFGWDANVDWGVTNANRLRVQSTDATSPTEWIGLYHDGTDGFVASGSGKVTILPVGSSQIVDMFKTTHSVPIFRILTTATGQAYLTFVGDTDAAYRLVADFSFDQALIASGAGTGRQVIVTDSTNFAKDHDHAAATNPALYAHSATNPDTDNTQWVGVSHNAIDAEIRTGVGGVVVGPGVTGEYRRGERTATASITTAVVGPTVLASLTLADGDVVHFSAVVAAVQSDASNRATYHLEGTFYRSGAAAAQEGVTTTVHAVESVGAAAWDCALAVSGTDVQVNVTGALGVDIRWAATVTTTKVNTAAIP